jgi:hypothetical protein
VLAAAAVTNTGPTVISADTTIAGGNLGLSPNDATSITGFPPGVVDLPGTIHAADAVAQLARADAGIAYGDLAGRTPDQLLGLVVDLGGRSFTTGVYNGASSLAITGTVTLDAEGDPDAIFIFQAGSTLGTAAASNVSLVNGAQACHVFWQVGSSATLGAASAFNGNIVAHTSVTIGNSADVQGRVLAGSVALSGAISLDTDLIHTPACAPSSGVPQAPLIGYLGTTAGLGVLLLGAAAFAVRRRTRPVTFATNQRSRA